MDPSWEDEDEEEEEEIEEAVSVGRRPSALAVIAVPSPLGKRVPGADGGREARRDCSLSFRPWGTRSGEL